MALVLFAIIGATIETGVGYWICYSIYSVCWLVDLAIKLND